MPDHVGQETAGRFGPNETLATARRASAVVAQSRGRPLTTFENWQAISELNMELAHRLHVVGVAG